MCLRKVFLAAVALGLLTFVADPAYSASPSLSDSDTMTCEGKIKNKPNSTNASWYDVEGDCSFDGNSPSGRMILDACGVGDPCKIKAFGEWEHHQFYIRRVIFAHAITQNAATSVVPDELKPDLVCDGTLVNDHGLRLRPFTRSWAGDGKTEPFHQDSRCNAVIPEKLRLVTKVCTDVVCHIEGTVVQHSKTEWRWDRMRKVETSEGD